MSHAKGSASTTSDWIVREFSSGQFGHADQSDVAYHLIQHREEGFPVEEGLATQLVRSHPQNLVLLLAVV